MYKIFYLMFVFLLIISSTVVLAEDVNADTNMVTPVFVLSVDGENAKVVINEIRVQIREMVDLGFNLNRIRDEFYIATKEFENVVEIERKGNIVGYSSVIERLNAVKATIALAYQVRDEIITVKSATVAVENVIDTTKVYAIISLAEQEFSDERYENAQKSIDQAYEKIIDLQSVEAKANAAYEATRKNLEGFLEEHGLNIVYSIIAIIIFYLLFRKKIKRFFIRKKIKINKDEIDVLKNEIKDTQQKYFIDGTLAEGSYSIKIKIYSEKIRNLNRENALLAEEIAGSKKKRKLSSKKDN